MMFLPAIDLMDGRCVRLLQGEREAKTEYSGDPARTAEGFARDGADAIHLVDLDGAFDGRRKNMNMIMSVILAAGIPVEVGGGIRTLQDIEALLEAGAWRVILGTAAVKQPDLVSQSVKAFGDDRIVLGVDVKQGYVAVKGWTEKTVLTAESLAKDMKVRGVRNLIYTEISRDGTLQGPDIEATAELAVITGLNVIVSGGVCSLKDIEAILEAEAKGITGFISGKAIYEGAFTVAEAAALVRGKRNSTNRAVL